MFKISWDKETGGIKLSSIATPNTLSVSPRPVFFEELNLLGLNKLGWKYPECEEPLLWACNKEYFYRGDKVFEAKGANIYDNATIEFKPGFEKLTLKPVNVAKMLEKAKEPMFLCESEAIEFIRDVYDTYTKASKLADKYAANSMDFEALVAKQEQKTKQKMAIVKEDCDSFDIMPLDKAQAEGKKVFQTTKIDIFLASFSGGKDSQVVLDLCTRALPPDAFQVIYSDTGYELPSSLQLYQEVQDHYHKLYPDLQFRLAKNHESVLNYWDKIGTPSDTHRWCCSVMKTAPLYRMLKVPGTNKQARVLTFDGVRAEESIKRAAYVRLGKGKHTTITNAHPILYWNAIEIFLYLFRYKLPINSSYRLGKARVGCIVCPFSTAWDDMIVKNEFPLEMQPFEERIKKWAVNLGIKDVDTYLKERKWKIKALGNKSNTDVIFQQEGTTFTANLTNPNMQLYIWLPALGEYSVDSGDKKDFGEIKFQGVVYPFELQHAENNKHKFTLLNCNNTKLIYLIKRVLYKSAYCVQCEVCEVDCPTGALSIIPNVNINKGKCIHCHKCLDSHDRGCIATDCIRMINDTDKKMANKVNAYKTFGLRSEWLDEFFADSSNFWLNNSLGTAQVDGFKGWLKDAEILDAKNALTSFGQFISEIWLNDVDLSWELIFTNLSHNSYIVNWFVNHIEVGKIYDRKSLVDAISAENTGVPMRTIENAVAALIQTFTYSPIGERFGCYVEASKNQYIRTNYPDFTDEGLAYCIYRFAEANDTKNLRVSDFYNSEFCNGPHYLFGLSKSEFEKGLHTLNSEQHHVLIANLSMGLEHITLRDDINSQNVVQIIQGK